MIDLNNHGLSLVWSQFWQVTVLILVVGLLTRLVCRHRPHLAYLLWMVSDFPFRTRRRMRRALAAGSRRTERGQHSRSFLPSLWSLCTQGSCELQRFSRASRPKDHHAQICSRILMQVIYY